MVLSEEVSTPTRKVDTPSSAISKAVSKIKKSDAKKKAIQESKHRRGIIMLSHIPHGFYEKQMSSFFKQFGKIHRVKLARSKKTGKSKGYGFVEFEFEEVARIAAETMDNYLMFERLVKCQLLGPEVNPRKIFSDRYIRPNNCPKVKNRNKIMEQQDVPTSPEQEATSANARLVKIKRQNLKLTKLGIDYEFTPSGINLEDITPKEKVGKKQKGGDNDDGEKSNNDSKKSTPQRKRKISTTSTVTNSPNITGTTINEEPIVAEKSIAITPPSNKKSKNSTTTTPSPAINNLSLNKTPNKKEKSKTPQKMKSPAVIANDSLDSNEKTPNKANKNNKKASKTPDIKKQTFSPKLLRSRASLLPQTPTTTTTTTKKQEIKTPKADKTPKISPKVLRNRKSVMKPEENVVSATSSDNNANTNDNSSKEEKTPKLKKTNFSPKILRSSIRQKN